MEGLKKDSYERVHEIVEEIFEAIKDQRDINTCKKLLDFLQDGDLSDEIFLERMTSEELFMQYDKMRKNRDKEADVQRLVDELNARKKRKLYLRKLRITISSIAASVIIFFMWQFLAVNSDKIPGEILSEQELYCEKPTLILSDGSKLELQGVADKLPDGLDGIRNIDQNSVTYDASDSVGKSVEYNTLIIPSGYTYNVEFVDGTEVVLNAGSRLRYPVTGGGDVREVELNGEAYFKVAKSSRPFIVKMADSFVKVYGTEFNVNNDWEGDVEVVLVEGRVGFKPEGGNEIILKSNQKCDYNSENGETSVNEVNAREYVAWLNNEFSYEQVPLDYFLKKVSAWYGVHFKYDKKRLEMIKFYVSTKRDIALSDLLLLIEKSTNLEFVRESENEFVIK
ncbi:FecR family protein [Butyricimonas paravirosa]|uniref:FecR family protein n=1 Tax=Butyricimonas paravirosa TaxID=1472417 RepID=UPI00210AA3B4|nr:FecR family protein [Butyricimonas paravirosa]MCQ4872316.1 FecR domain-containing protein [Butyricimonas paravirosa]